MYISSCGQRTRPHTEIWTPYTTNGAMAIFPLDGCVVHQPSFCSVLYSQEYDLGNSLAVQWLGLHAFTSHAAKKKKKEYDLERSHQKETVTSNCLKIYPFFV